MTEFLYHFAFAQMFICAGLLVPSAKKSLSIKLFILLMLCSCAYLFDGLTSSPIDSSGLWWLSHVGGNALPGVFWLVSLSVFGEEDELKTWQYSVASMTLVVPLFIQITTNIVGYNLANHERIYGFLTYGALLLELVLISHALYIAAMQWRNDLVQERRYIRGGVISVAALYIILVIVFEQLLKVDWLFLDTIKALALAVLAFAVNFVLFQLKAGSLFDSIEPSVDKVEKVSPQSKELKKVVESMEHDKLYQQDGLTIASLAKHLTIHEYKLRSLINGELNYRNFNDFLNFYRVKEVSQHLTDPEQASTPVLTLALESGFRSLSSFNKAFKANHGVTPTEYRKKHLSEC